MKSELRFIVSLVAGCFTAVAIALAGVTVARALWPAYANAEPHKTYTLAMLCSRLAVGALCTAGAACVTTIVAQDNGRAAWWLGVLFFVISFPYHLYPGYSWSNYPVWYHVFYLSSLVPVTGLTAQIFQTAIKRLRSAA